MSDHVRAAGGVVRRRRDDGSFEYAIIHRPKYDDWSLPKGKLDEGEGFEQAARREVEEETGLRCRLVDDAGETRYVDNKGRDKVVRYWLMEPVGGAFTPHEEVDGLVWLSLGAALAKLSYEHDRRLVAALAADEAGERRRTDSRGDAP